MRALVALLLMTFSAFAGREFVAASSQFLVVPIDPVSSPLSVSIRVWKRQVSANTLTVALNTSSNATERVQIFYDVVLSNRWVSGRASASGTTENLFGTTSAGTNRFYHVCATFPSSTSAKLYVDGALEYSGTATVSADGFDTIGIGARKSTTWGGFFTGTLAEVAVWSQELNASEVAQLASGLTPNAVRPGARVAYIPLWGSSTPEVELWRGYPVLHTNAPAGANGLHPPIYR